ncbi:septum formation inhibitor Maf [Proteobacteria bacterium 005FR1]|nr:septum formation inhibitor Maf [Proteobacteria bacterium 005FR1]
MIYLASQSPRRRELLEQIGVHYQLLAIAVDESSQTHEAPCNYVARLAAAKARAGMELLRESEHQAPVLGADTTVVLDAQIMGKPRDKADAQQMLRALSGRTHQVISAVSLATPGRQITRTSSTEVRFRELNDQLIARYWRTGEPCDKAGGYGIQGFGAVFVESIAGSYSGVVGLPIEVLAPMLNEFGVGYWEASGRE